jgi:hypothetical protein
MTLSQILAFHAEHVEQLSKVSSILGFAYGSTFSLLPMVTLEWFGAKHFAGVSRLRGVSKEIVYD